MNGLDILLQAAGAVEGSLQAWWAALTPQQVIDEALKAVGVIIVIFGPVVAWRGHALLRRTGQDTVAANERTEELKATTERLKQDLEVLRALVDSYKVVGEERAKLADAQGVQLAAVLERETLALAREAECRLRLDYSDRRLTALFRHQRVLGEQLVAMGIAADILEPEDFDAHGDLRSEAT